jgi:hypothetical protein
LGASQDTRTDEPAPPEAEPARPSPREGPTERERRLAWWLLIAVGVGFLVTQLVVAPPGRPTGWDEAVYVSQVTPRMEALFMAAWRARGITLLIAPVTLLGGSLDAVHLYLTILSAVAVTLAFRLWIPLIGFAAPIGAFLFSFGWVAVASGSAVMPNFSAAVLGVAVAGLVLRRLEGGGIGYAVGAAAALGAMALVRPTEAVVAAGAIGLFVLIVRWTSWRFVLGLGVGLLAGWLPWILEMSIRFGGPAGALEAANSAGHLAVASLRENVIAHLSFTYGRRKPPPGGPPIAGLFWWGMLVVLAALGLRRRAGAPARQAALLATMGAAAFAVEYLVLVPISEPRFLLPAYAFAAIAAATGLASLLRGGSVARAVGVVVLAAAIPLAIWQVGVAERVVAREGRRDGIFEDAGLLLRDLAHGRPCSFVSPGSYPQLHLVSGCVGHQLEPPPIPTAAQWDAIARGEEVFMILPRVAPADSPLSVLTPIQFEAPKRTWFIYQLSQLNE